MDNPQALVRALKRVGSVVGALAVVVLSAPAHGQPTCTSTWSDQFALPGVGANITDAVIWNDGTGPALYAVGFFASRAIGRLDTTLLNTTPPIEITSPGNIAKWDGRQWNFVGGPNFFTTDPQNSLTSINSVQIFDPDGPGPMPEMLVAGGRANGFSNAIPATTIMFDGINWLPMGSSLGSDSSAEIRDLQVYNGNLYACGKFSEIGIENIAMWDIGLQDWVSVGSGIPNTGNLIQAEKMAVYNNELYVAGTFDFVGDFLLSRRLAKWDGTQWLAVPGFVNTTTLVTNEGGAPSLLKTIDIGDGPGLLVGDARYTGGPAAGSALARLKDGVWSTLITQATGVNKSYPYDAVMFPGPEGQQLHVVGSRLLNGQAGALPGASFARRTSTGTFEVLGEIPVANGAGSARFLFPVDWDASGPGGTKLLLAAQPQYRGLFLPTYSGLTLLNIGLWNGTSMESAFSGSDDLGLTNGFFITAKELDPDGAGPQPKAMYFAHSSLNISGTARTTGLTVYDGTTLSDTPTGVIGVTAFNTGPSGTGETALYAAGLLPGTSIGTPTSSLFRLTSSTWQTVGTGEPSPASTFELGNAIDAVEPAVIAGEQSIVVAGRYFRIAGVDARWVSRFNGTAWSAMDSGLPAINPQPNRFLNPNGAFVQLATVQGQLYLLLTYRYFDGSLALPAVAELYRWNGSSWVLASGALPSDSAAKLAVIDLGSGQQLYVGGKFQNLGGVSGVDYVARFNGSTFQGVNTTPLSFANPAATASGVSAVGVFDFGAGPTLVAVLDSPASSGTSPVRGLIRLVSGAWEGVSGGETLRRSNTILGSTSATWGGLYVTGDFRAAGGFESQGVARLVQACTCPADFDGSGVRDVADIFAFLSAWFANAPSSDFNSSGTRDVADIFAFLSAWFAGCP